VIIEGGKSIVSGKGFDFSVRLVKLYCCLFHRERECQLSRQLLRRKISIGVHK